MRRCLALVVALAPLFVLAADPPADKDKEAKQPVLRVGGNVPGPFHPFNVTGKYGPRKVKDEEVDGTFHCPVTEHSEDPMVLVFSRDAQFDEKSRSVEL